MHLNLVAHLQQKRAGIFQAPLHIRNGEIGRCAEVAVVVLDQEMEGHLMARVAELEYSMRVDLGFALSRKRAGNAVGDEDGLRVFRALENVLVHAPVASVAASIPASDVDRDLSAGFAGLCVETNVSALEVKTTMHGVQDIAEGKRHGGARRIQIDGHFLRR